MTGTGAIEASEKLVNDLHAVFIGIVPVGQDHDSHPLLRHESDIGAEPIRRSCLVDEDVFTRGNGRRYPLDGERWP